jgi:hypothetical protein
MTQQEMVQLRTNLATAESIYVALCHRLAEARMVAARAELDEQKARVLVSDARNALDEALGRELDREDARRWREHVATCGARPPMKCSVPMCFGRMREAEPQRGEDDRQECDRCGYTICSLTPLVPKARRSVRP